MGNAFPNPFNPYTRFSFTVDTYSPVSIRIYNLRGRLVAIIAEENLYSGEYTYLWNGKKLAGQSVASGIYFINLTVDKNIESRQKVILLS